MIFISRIKPMIVFLTRVWRLAKPYWRSHERCIAYALLFALLCLGFLFVRMQVLANGNTRLFYDALQHYQPQLAWHYALLYISYILVIAVCAALSAFLGDTLINRWRRWLSFYYLDHWLDHKAYYQMPLGVHAVDNPDQRIADDIEQFTTMTLSLFNGFYATFIQLVTFTFVLWHLSGAYQLVVHGFAVAIPGYLVGCALLYAGVSTGITCWLGHRLAHLNYQQQHFNANFRFGLMRVRENAEQIALQQGANFEKQALQQCYQSVFGNFRQLITVNCRLTFFTQSASYLSMIIGTLFALPKFMMQRMSIGDLMQISSAFAYVVSGLGFFMTAYREMASWRAVVDRLSEFEEKIALSVKQQQSNFVVNASQSGDLVLNSGIFSTPQGRVLAVSGSYTFKVQEHTLIMGVYGSGKSTLLRSMAGIWPFAKGVMTKPPGSRLFLSQKPYFPIGTLQAALCFPLSSNDYALQTIIDALLMLRLDHYVALLSHDQHWMNVLSLGEQQSLSFVRVLLHKPQWLFLDEATASLDESTEAFLYQCLATAMPDTTLISVGHRRSLKAQHTRVIGLS